MNYLVRICGCLAALILSVSLAAFAQTANNSSDASTKPHVTTRVPSNVILVKGAWSSASDSITALPESESLTNNVFRNEYFDITYPLPPDWVEKYTGPPPSDSGRYVLALIQRPGTYKGDARGNILIIAQDMFFTPLPADNALQMVNLSRNHLSADYKLEMRPTRPEIAGHDFAGLAYWSPIAGLHWYALATEIRCHMVEFVFMNRDQQTLESMVAKLNKMKLPREASSTGGTGGGAVPVCIKNYASTENVIARVDPFFGDLRFNPIPVRIIIDKQGRVKHIHFLSAFPDQAKAISDALNQWKFRPYVRNGQRLEVETGIMFGRAPRPLASAKRAGRRAAD